MQGMRRQAPGMSHAGDGALGAELMPLPHVDVVLVVGSSSSLFGGRGVPCLGLLQRDVNSIPGHLSPLL